MSKKITFTVSEDDVYDDIKAQARYRGMTPSQLARTTLYDYMGRSPCKDVIALREHREAVKTQSNGERGS